MDDQFFMKKALSQAEDALSRGDFPVGAVVVGEGRILSSGFRTSTIKGCANEVDHAEINALRNLKLSLGETPETMYPKDLTIYATMEPCLMCFAACILSGIKRVVYAFEDVMGGGTGVHLSELPMLYSKSGIIVVPHVMREASLALFKRFFSSPLNTYWKDSILAEYVLSQ